MSKSIYFLAIWVLSLSSLVAADKFPVRSIIWNDLDGFKDLRRCVRDCFTLDRDELRQGCATSDCICRDDLASPVHSLISSCVVTKRCSSTNSVDVSQATAFFDNYCASYGGGSEASGTASGPAAASATATDSPVTSGTGTGTPVQTGSAGSTSASTTSNSVSNMDGFPQILWVAAIGVLVATF